MTNTRKKPVEDIDGCHYGCWFGGRCMGAAREDVLGFLAAEYKKDYEHKLENLMRAPNWHLNEELADMFDEGYKGPTHVSIEDVDAKCMLSAGAELIQSDPDRFLMNDTEGLLKALKKVKKYVR